MELEGIKALITGGAGFVGSHLADELLKTASLVIVYDNFDPFYGGKEENVAHNLSNPKYKLVRADILDFSLLLSLAKKVDVIFHLAAQPGVRFSVENPQRTVKVNVDGTLNVLMAAKQAGVRKVVFASSSSVYGNPSYVPMDEEHPRRPTSPYGASKVAAEEYCRVFNQVYGVNVVSLRYFSVYGPRQRPDQVIRVFAERVARGESPVIYGSGEQTRDFTYVMDVVDATIRAAQSDDVEGEVFNIGFGAEVKIVDLAEKIIELMGAKGKVQMIFKPAYKGDFPRTLADNRKAGEMLGWRPKVSLDQGLKLFLAWFNARKSEKGGSRSVSSAL
ncbi:MAG: UDP-glucose 4-epimerase [Thermoprotei archaeon]|nr:MAG: UDP-glucose 4-epimerase [Thermoprotei archaeon]RLF18746.1 MAG: UDP-glucose 4-epimerase [Thermoprotei archaeon]